MAALASWGMAKAMFTLTTRTMGLPARITSGLNVNTTSRYRGASKLS